MFLGPVRRIPGLLLWDILSAFYYCSRLPSTRTIRATISHHQELPTHPQQLVLRVSPPPQVGARRLGGERRIRSERRVTDNAGSLVTENTLVDM